MRSNFSQLRELQAHFNESIITLCVATVERIMKGELEDEFPDDTREVTSLFPTATFSFVCLVIHR